VIEREPMGKERNQKTERMKRIGDYQSFEIEKGQTLKGEKKGHISCCKVKPKTNCEKPRRKNRFQGKGGKESPGTTELRMRAKKTKKIRTKEEV